MSFLSFSQSSSSGWEKSPGDEATATVQPWTNIDTPAPTEKKQNNPPPPISNPSDFNLSLFPLGIVPQ